jgi:Ca2+-binding EF-hand superfamily protein
MSKENLVKLEEAFTNSREPGVISLNLMKRNINLLAPELLDKGKSVTKREIQDRLAHLNPDVKRTLVKISEYLKKERIDTMSFYEMCDKDGDGLLTADEFVDGILSWRIVGMKDKHLRDAFAAIDVNKDEDLTLGEIWMYIEGAKPSAQERNLTVEKDIENDMKEQINNLYNEFKDESKNVTKDSMRRILTAFSIPLNVISKTLNDIPTDKDGSISKGEFKKYMTKFLKENILEIENDINELRAMFYEADLNHSGFLDMDELYNFFNLKLRANITRDELKALVQSIDLDYDGEVDIDEFITLMTKNPADKQIGGSAQATYMRIKRNRKFDMTEFIKFLKKFPEHFQESFTARLYRNKFNLPSSVFTSGIIPNDGEGFKVSKKVEIKPYIKTSDPLVAAQILLEGAKGVPQPEEEKLSIEDIAKRVVRVSIFDFKKQKFIANSSFVIASCNPRYKDIWKFNKWSETGTNPLIFRTEEYECKDNAFIIFEFVIYCKQDKDIIKELNCGWCRLAVKDFEKKTGKHILEIEGGSPELTSEVSYLDKNKKKIKGKGQLTVSFRGVKDFSDESKFHFKMLPTTCVFQKRLITLLVGFRNYLGKERFGDIKSGEALTLPTSNFMIITFPKILDNPDACEHLITFWNDVVVKKIKDKYDLRVLMESAETVISKLYPVIYSTTFD